MDFGFDEWISMCRADAGLVKHVKEMMLAAMEHELADLNVRFMDEHILFTYNTKIIVGRKK